MVVRPEPGNSHTADRLRRAGFQAIQLPLFAVRAVSWQPPADDYDALLFTSANAVTHAGAALDRVRRFPVVAVGEATARAAREAGLAVTLTGSSDVEAIVREAETAGMGRLLHLAGRDRRALPGVDAITVYASEPLPVTLAEPGGTVLLHSPRAAARFAALVDEGGGQRAAWTLAAFSAAVAAAAGNGWRRVVVAPAPTDDALIAALIAAGGPD